MFIFGLCSTSDDRLGWSMDLNPIDDSMPEQETCEFQFQMHMDIWPQTPSATPLQPKK